MTRIPIKPCPFCGAAPVVRPWHGGPKTKRMIACENEAGCYVLPKITGRTRGVAVQCWNQRDDGEPS